MLCGVLVDREGTRHAPDRLPVRGNVTGCTRQLVSSHTFEEGLLRFDKILLDGEFALRVIRVQGLQLLHEL
jgi:hypothetical protein